MSSQKALLNTLTFYHWDETLFDTMQVPEGMEKDDIVENILLQTSEFPLIIGDFKTLKFSIGLWSRHRVDIWQHLLDTTQYEYNPIENYNRHETVEEEMAHTGSGSVRGDGGTDTTVYSRDLEHSGEFTESTTDSEEINRESTQTDSGTDTVTNSGTDTTTNSGSDIVTDSGTDTVTNSGTDLVTLSGTDTTSETVSDDIQESGTDVTIVDELTIDSKTGTDTTTESVAPFNSGGLTTHTVTEQDYNNTLQTDHDSDTRLTHGKKTEEDISKSGSTTYGKEESTQHGLATDTDYGKVETTQHGHVEALQHGQQVDTDYGKIENVTGEETRSGEGSRTGSDTKTESEGGTETYTHRTGNIETRDFKDARSFETFAHGNIGVMSTQDMIKQEREIAIFDVIDVITQDYIKEFCVAVY